MAVPNEVSVVQLKNHNRFAIVQVVCAVANRAYEFPPIEIPDGVTAVVKSDPGNAAISRVWVGPTVPSVLPNSRQSWPLVFNEAIGLMIKGTKRRLYVSSNIAGSIAWLIAEQEG